MAPIKKVGIPQHLKCCVAPKTTENLSAQEEIGAGGFTRELWINESAKNADFKYPLNRTSTTKYTLLSFFPKGLYEQFRRLANLYFLFSAAISLTPLTPYSPVTVILPLVFVIGVSLIKEAIEDWRRHGADVEINNRKVLRHGGGGAVEAVRWRDVRVGDVVTVEKDAFFPADLLFLAASSEEGSCYVETMNLDGETNLKVRRALDKTREVHNDLASFKDAYVKCEDPNPSLYTFVGTLQWGGETISIPPTSILLRDSKLRNTEWVVGAVVFTGHDTKVLQNATAPPSKRSSLEKQMDKIIIALFLALFIMAFVTGLVYGLLTKHAMPAAWYLAPSQPEVYWDPGRAAVGGILQFITGLVLYGYLIPISLYVTVEIVKVLQAFNISQDLHMYYAETDQPTNCRTSNLNEELGQIDTILTDKTGTLTCNQMEFFKCSVAGVSYGTGQTEVEKAAIKRMKAEGRWHGDEESGGGGALSLSSPPASPPTSNGASNRPLPSVGSEGEIESGGQATTDSHGLPGAISSPKGGVNRHNGVNGPASPSSGTVGSPRRFPPPKRKGFNLVDDRLLGGRWVEESDPATLRMFLRILALCHTAIPEGEPTPDQIVYQVESPDEGALVQAANIFGFFFYRRTSSAVYLKEPAEDGSGKQEDNKYDVLNLLEFDSTRKRMSVIVRDPAGKILLLTKGADNVIYERLGPSGKLYAPETKEHLDDYSQAGLRTLCFAFRVIDPAEYKTWSKTFDAAKAIVGPERGQKVDEAAEEIEKDLTLVGCTGVEDKLQDGVPETIDKLAKAGLKIWVLTGDKVETAINIGYACSLLRQGMNRIVVSLDKPEVQAAEEAGGKERLFEVSMRLTVEQLDEGLARIEGLRKKEAEAPDSEPAVFALVIDGKSLTFALDSQNKDKFLELAQACAAVIACRVSPKQKALVTYLVKEALGKICLGIGDGANDVGMINAADIGVGISGFEGTQAVMASDFAIGQFRYLERLLLVHGRWCYRRIALMISYFFYKNVTFGLTLFLFSRYAYFSVQPIYDDWYLTFYNLIFTSLPVLAVGVLDQDVSARASTAFPALYLQGQANSYFSWSKISAWMLNGIYAALINYYLIIHGCTPQAFARSGRPAGMYDIGSTMYTSILWTVTFQMCLAIGYWTWVHHLFIWGSMALWYLFCLAYNALPTNIVPNVHKALVERLAPAPAFWLLCLLVPTVAVLPDFIYRCLQRMVKPLDVHVIQEVEKSELFKRDPQAWEAMAARAQKETGFGFSRAVDDIVAGAVKLPKRVFGLVRKKKGTRKRKEATSGGVEMAPV